MASNPPIEQEIQEIKQTLSKLITKLDEIEKTKDDSELAKIRLDERRVVLEEEKHKIDIQQAGLRLDEKRFLLEAEKQKKEVRLAGIAAYTTPLSILIPLLIAAASFAFSVISANNLAKSEFELKAAEIIMTGSSPSQSKAKARTLAAIFPERLGADFASSYDPEEFSGPSVDSKKELIHLIAEHPEQKTEILSVWKEVFPGDDWVDNISTGEPSATTSTTTSVGAAIDFPSSSDSWAQIAEMLHDNPALVEELLSNEGFIQFLNELINNEEFQNLIKSKITNDGTINPEVLDTQNPPTPSP